MERQNVEWKREWKDDNLKEIAGFANASGGILQIGVDDDGTIIGVRDPKDVMKKISDTVAHRLALNPSIDYDESTGVITVYVEHSLIPVDINGTFYIRSGNTIHEARGREFDCIMSKRVNISWLDQPVQGYDESKLDVHALDYFRKKVAEVGIFRGDSINISDAELLSRLDLMVDGNVTRAGLLLFHPHPEDMIIGSFTKIALFIDSEIVVQDIIGGPLVCRFDSIMQTFSTKYFSKQITYHGWTRVEMDPFPTQSLRESVLNALIHNDYSSFNPVQIRIWPEGMMISDSGGLPDGWTTDDIQKTHLSMPVNPKIAYTFFLMGFIENWGRGIERVFKGYDGYEGRGVRIRADRNYFQVEMDAIITLEDVRDQLFGKKKVVPLDVEVQILIKTDVPEGVSSYEIGSSVGLSSMPYLLKRYIRPLMEKGLLEYTVPDKPRSRNQKYRTTEDGRSFYNQALNGKESIVYELEKR